MYAIIIDLIPTQLKFTRKKKRFRKQKVKLKTLFREQRQVGQLGEII